MTDTIQQLVNQLDSIKQQLGDFHRANGKWFNAQDLFVSNSFHSQSEEVNDYLIELESNIQHLGRLSNLMHAEFLAERIRDQFACLKNLLNSQTVNTKHQTQRASTAKRVNRLKQLTRQVTQSSQELYQELSKLQEYERRLIEMVAEKQQILHQYQGKKHRQEYQQQVLVTQQRLGRCRQALSKVEEQIQQLDNKN